MDDFDRNAIADLLQALHLELEHRGIRASVYIVGGAAMVLREISGDRRTADVDALMVPEEEVRAASRSVAMARGLRADWLNANVRPYVPLVPSMAPPARPGLRVVLAEDDQLLAMKIVAARGERDMRDIVPLARRLGLQREQELLAVVLAAYGDDVIEDVHGGAAEMALRCRAIEARLRRVGNHNTQTSD